MTNFIKQLSFTTFLLASLSGLAQKNSVEDKVSTYPSRFASVEALANKIESDFDSKEDKAKAAYVWMAKHINYDVEQVNKTSRVAFKYFSKEELLAQKRAFRKELAQKTLRRKKAICEGYATLFKELCLAFNIECEIITGSSKTFISEIGYPKLPSNHSWNAYKLNGKWYLVDVTWGAGSVDFNQMRFKKLYTAAYFNCKPEKFLINHFPDDEKWQLLPNKLSLSDFGKQYQAYQAYWDSGIELIAPQSGILKYKKGDSIQFTIEKLSPKYDIAYKYRNEKYGNKVTLKRRGKSCTFSVPMTHLRKNELIIYIDTKPTLGFKTQRR
ncbi:hypothetical protein L3073_11085 [Ancylomarina sp. DW003]|nr:transglutaminase domain-containing protein [Ancylomarina sp. DW003]MDE5422752.1 hypothetical protein [Ancylomarina sp. DW003]